jgi:hypothetical protein
MSKTEVRSKIIKTVAIGTYIGGALFEPKRDENTEKARYSAAIVLDPGEDLKIKKAVEHVISQKYPNKKPKLVDWTVREGDDEEYEHSFGKKFINAKSVKPPMTIIKRNGVVEKILQDDDLLYPGCKVVVSLSPFCYEGDSAKGIKPGVSLNLRSVMFLKHGERLTDVVDPESEFEGYESEVEESIDAEDDVPF